MKRTPKVPAPDPHLMDYTRSRMSIGVTDYDVLATMFDAAMDCLDLIDMDDTKQRMMSALAARLSDRMGDLATTALVSGKAPQFYQKDNSEFKRSRGPENKYGIGYDSSRPRVR